jgi:hypothetical protein
MKRKKYKTKWKYGFKVCKHLHFMDKQQQMNYNMTLRINFGHCSLTYFLME